MTPGYGVKLTNLTLAYLLMVGMETLTLLILVRIQVGQPIISGEYGPTVALKEVATISRVGSGPLHYMGVLSPSLLVVG